MWGLKSKYKDVEKPFANKLQVFKCELKGSLVGICAFIGGFRTKASNGSNLYNN